MKLQTLITPMNLKLNTIRRIPSFRRHSLQAAKTLNSLEKETILKAPTPGVAKRLGRKCTLRPDWDTIKDSVMYSLVYEKFANDSYLRHKLIATNKEELIEGNYWHDNYWGSCTCGKCGNHGKNQLGKILMRVRKELSLGQSCSIPSL